MRYGGLIAAIVFAAIAAIVVLRVSDGGSSPSAPAAVATQEVKGVPVYIAKTAIPVGTALTKEMVDTQAWPDHLVLAGFMKATEENSGKIAGMVARGSFQQGEPIIESKLANPNDPNFLAGDLPKGMRVVTIPLNEVDGVAGFVFPGDHVDLIYTHDIEKQSMNEAAAITGQPTVTTHHETITETLLTNVKVLAVDQRASNAGSTDSKGNLVVPKSASVMVSQSDAQRVRLAQKTGTVSLALRSISDKESADPLLMTKSHDVSQWQGGDDGSTSTEGVRIVRGAPQRPEENLRGSPMFSGSTAIPAANTITPQVAP